MKLIIKVQEFVRRLFQEDFYVYVECLLDQKINQDLAWPLMLKYI